MLWLQPLIDQLWGSGNLGRIVRFARDGGPGGGGTTLGLGDAVRAAAMVLVRPPFWLRGGMASSLPNGGGFVRTFGTRIFRPDWLSAPVATLGLLAIAAVVVAFGVVGRRRGDDAVVAGALVSVAALVGAVISLSGLPIDEFGFSAHKARWLWAIGAFLTAYVVVSWLRVGRIGDRRDAVLTVAVFGGIALVCAVPTSNERLSPQQYLTRYEAAAQRLRDAADELVGRGTIFIDTAGGRSPTRTTTRSPPSSFVGVSTSACAATTSAASTARPGNWTTTRRSRRCGCSPVTRRSSFPTATSAWP